MAEGYPVDASLTEAHKAIFTQGNDVEWDTLTLDMHMLDRHDFDVERVSEEEMRMEPLALATMIVNLIAPYLAQAGEVMAKKAGEAAWEKAQALWGKLKARFRDDPEVTSAATMVAAKPEDKGRQAMLAEVLGIRLQENPDLVQELLDLLGGQEAVQQVLAGRSSWVEDVTQRMKGTGAQTVKASDDSVIKGVRQTME